MKNYSWELKINSNSSLARSISQYNKVSVGKASTHFDWESPRSTSWLLQGHMRKTPKNHCQSMKTKQTQMEEDLIYYLAGNSCTTRAWTSIDYQGLFHEIQVFVLSSVSRSKRKGVQAIFSPTAQSAVFSFLHFSWWAQRHWDDRNAGHFFYTLRKRINFKTHSNNYF